VAIEAHIDGAYALDAGKRAQWQEMEEFPPYEIAVDDGADLYRYGAGRRQQLRGLPRRGRAGGQAALPVLRYESGAVVTLEQAINACREAAGDEPWDYLGAEMSALSAFIAWESRGETVAVEIPDDPAAWRPTKTASVLLQPSRSAQLRLQ
jgi:sulfur-oxidizing protein SoxA